MKRKIYTFLREDDNKLKREKNVVCVMAILEDILRNPLIAPYFQTFPQIFADHLSSFKFVSII